ncbi:transposase [Anabaena cylindrica PCC 7122]|nr:transposase [Anabaena cylindrica PCC 7122]
MNLLDWMHDGLSYFPKSIGTMIRWFGEVLLIPSRGCAIAQTLTCKFASVPAEIFTYSITFKSNLS